MNIKQSRATVRPRHGDNNATQHSWSHNHYAHEKPTTNSSSKLSSVPKLNSNFRKRYTNKKIRVPYQADQNHKNQSGDTTQSKRDASITHKKVVPTASVTTSVPFVERNSNSTYKDKGTENQGKVFSQDEDDERDDILAWKGHPDDAGPVIKQNNYGVGFQYEIAPYQSHNLHHSTPDLKSTPRPEIITTPMTTTTRTKTTTPSYIDPATRYEEGESIASEDSERSNPWKKVPTLTVTIRPAVDQLYPSSPLPPTRTKVKKRPHWGLGSTQRPTTSHIHNHFPFKTRVKTTPPPSYTIAHLDFDTPASPSPTESSFSKTPDLSSAYDESFFGFSSYKPKPFSPTTVPQHVHIRPHFENYHQVKPSEIASLQGQLPSSSASSLSSLTRPFTNIWYKPIINHFISSTSSSSSGADHQNTETTASNDFHGGGLIFKIWNYNNGKLTLVNENVIPAGSALDSFQLENGSILNLDEIPISVQDVVASAISEFNENQKNNFNIFDTPNYYNSEPTLKINYGHEITEQIAKPIASLPHQEKKYVNYVIMDRKSPATPELDDMTYRPTLEFGITTDGAQSFPANSHMLKVDHQVSSSYRPQVIDSDTKGNVLAKFYLLLHYCKKLI